MSGAETTRIIERHGYICNHHAHFQMQAYRRPAAGRQRLQTIRSRSELHSAVIHLLQCVLTLSILDLRHRYDYIADRLRQIRQEIIVQNINDLALIEPQIRFHVAARDLLSDDDAFNNALNDAMLADCISHASNSEYEDLWRISQGELVVRNGYTPLISAVVTRNFIQVFNFIGTLPYIQACLMLPLVNRCRLQYIQRIKKSYRNPTRGLFCKLLRCRPEQIDDAFVQLSSRVRDDITKCDFDYNDGSALSNIIMPN